jgi:hypothetical protein
MLTRGFRACGLAAIMAVLLVGTARAEAPTKGDARALFEAGVNYLKEKPEPRYEDALQLFRASYAQSGNFRALLPMGICELHLERDGQAIAHFQQYLSEGGVHVKHELRAQAERDIATLSASLARVTISVDPVGATIVDERTPVDGRPIVNRYSAAQPNFTLGIHPGHHKFTVNSFDRVPQQWTFEAAPGATLSAQFRLEPKTPATPPPKPVEAPRLPTPQKGPDAQPDNVPIGEYLGFGATGGLLSGAIVTGLVAHGKKNDLRDVSGTPRVDEANKLHDEAVRYQVANGILLVGALVTGGVTAYFHFFRKNEETGGDDTARRSEADGLGLRLQPELGTQSGRLTLSGEF